MANPNDAPCPLCKQQIAAAIPDRQLERLLNAKLVFCSNKRRGCTWYGELVKFEGYHLNENPQTPDKVMEGCLYVQVLCSQCQRVMVERQEMENHIKTECPRRMAVCTYCKTHRAAYEDINQIHHPVCQQFPVPCPKGCGAKPLRKNIKMHLANWCPKNPQPCPFHIVGCTKKLSGRQMEKHLTDWVVYEGHLSNMQKTVAALRKDICEKESQIRTLQNEKDAQVGELLSKIEKKELDMRVLLEHKDETIGNLRDELAAQRNRLEDLANVKEQEVKVLHEKLDYLKEMCAQNIKKKNAAETAINALLGEVTERDKQIEKLKKQNADKEVAAKQLKDENVGLRRWTDPLRKEYTELQVHMGQVNKENDDLQKHTDYLTRENKELKADTDSLEARVSGMKGTVIELKNKLHTKAAHADVLKRQVKELQQVVQSQKRDLKRYAMMGEQEPLKKKVTELQLVIQTKQEKILQLTHEAEQWYHERDSLRSELRAKQYKIDKHTARLKEQTSQTDNDPPADGSGGLGVAAAGVALGFASIAGAALMRHLNQ